MVSLVSSSHICVYCPFINPRETSNKALNAINEIALIPFLMSFLASREKLPLTTVVSAGMSFSTSLISCSEPSIPLAQCLYVLTDDNRPATQEVRHNAGYLSCLLSIVREENPKKENTEQTLTLSVLASGTFSWYIISCPTLIDLKVSYGMYLQYLLPLPPP